MEGRDAQELPLAHPLTPREQEVLNCLGKGMKNRQIAEELTLALSTVKWYVRQLFNKLGVSDREAAVARAQRLGLLPDERRRDFPRNNLPVAVTPIVGREEELASLASLIGEPQAPLITILGPGGVGKTRLALEAAGRQLRGHAQFPDGIFFVPMASITTAAEIVTTLATELDFYFRGAERGSQSEKQQLIAYLGQKQMLLVLDNYEQLLEGRDLLVDIYHQAPGIKLLVTSRERLQLQGEQLFPLQGLRLPESADGPASAQASYPAAELFLACAKRIAPGFQLLEGDAGQLFRICQLVEGMPLGLELAASWVGVLPLAVMASEISQSLDLLAVEHHDLPPRHRSMQAALDVSWKRLDHQQKASFQSLTAFRGGFTRESALMVGNAPLPLLVSLVNKSWLSYDRLRDRYAIHELLRQFGATKLRRHPEEELLARQKHSAYFCSYLAARASDWVGARQKEIAREVRRESYNIQRAWRWAADQGEEALLAQALHSLCRFYLWEGRMQDGVLACQLAERHLSNSLKGQDPGEPRMIKILVRVLAWKARFVIGQEEKAQTLERSQALLDQLADRDEEAKYEQAFVLLIKADAAIYQNIVDVVRFTDRGRALFQELGNRWGVAQTFLTGGLAYLLHGDYRHARDHFRQGLQIQREMGNTKDIAESILGLGMVARHQGEFEEAEALAHQSLELIRQLGNRYREADCLYTLSYMLSWAGKFNDAYETALQVRAIETDLGLYPNPGTLNLMSKAALHLGRVTKARVLALEALELSRQTGQSMETGWSLMFLGESAIVDGELETAKRNLSDCLAILGKIKHGYKAVPRAMLSLVDRALGDLRSAHNHVKVALASGTRNRSVSHLIYALPAAALLALDAGQLERAFELYGVSRQFGHITNSRWFEKVFCHELEAARAQLPPELAAAAEDRGGELDVWAAAEDLLTELART